jgi:DNA-binding response OmpR family regulator
MARVLIIEDEREYADTLSGVLAASGLQVDWAPDGRQGLAKLRRQHPDIVLLDFMMPVMDGAAVLRAMRKHGRLCRVPVVMMSATAETIVRRHCPGSFPFLRKPFDLRALTTMLDDLLLSPVAPA